MDQNKAIAKLADYAIRSGLVEECDRTWAINTILDVLKLDSYTEPAERDWDTGHIELAPILEELLDDAYARGVLTENSVVYRDLFDTELMGRLTPRPALVTNLFQKLCEKSPKKATDWYYKFSQDTNYIRRDRIAKDMQWKAPTEYGELDITINLSKPEKDPKAIAAAKNLPASAYPRCQLCAENEGYAGRVNHPARQNHRIVPITINGSPWFLQYSPYVYYNEHCICLNSEHVPMKIDRACFAKLLDFVRQFPHYFVGSNADLPIVGGSILAHDHFQGGHYTFAMERAPVETPVTIRGFEDYDGVTAALVDSCMGITCGIQCGLITPTISMTINYARPVPLDASIVVRTRTVRCGATAGHIEAEVYPAGQPETLLVTASGAYSTKPNSLSGGRAPWEEEPAP